jgi:hypothetical protein
MATPQMSYEEAVTNLQAMFTRIEPEVIGAVLESSGFQLELAIEQLLTLDPAGDGAVSDAGPGGRSGSPVRDLDDPDRPPRTTFNSEAVVGSLDGALPTTVWRHTLPDDFLAVPGSSAPGGAVTSTSQEQMVEDAALAEMLSNEMFMEQLRSDPEFAAYLGQEAAYLDGLHGDDPRAEAGDKKSMKERLSTMGTGMKRRFANLASKFRRNDKGASRTPRGIGSSAAPQGEYQSLLGGGDGADDARETMTTDIDLDVAGDSAFFALGGDSDDDDDALRRRRSVAAAAPSAV